MIQWVSRSIDTHETPEVEGLTFRSFGFAPGELCLGQPDHEHRLCILGRGQQWCGALLGLGWLWRRGSILSCS